MSLRDRPATSASSTADLDEARRVLKEAELLLERLGSQPSESGEPPSHELEDTGSLDPSVPRNAETPAAAPTDPPAPEPTPSRRMPSLTVLGERVSGIRRTRVGPPKIAWPRIKVPEIAWPRIKVPDVTWPKLRWPDVALPPLPDLRRIGERTPRWAAAVALLLLGAVAATVVDDPPVETASEQPGVHVWGCEASWYAGEGTTAAGEPFGARRLSAAANDIPFGTRLLVTNTRTLTSVVVVVTDRGPAVEPRCLDLSRAAFSRLAPPSAGVIPVRVEALPPGEPEELTSSPPWTS